MFKIAQQNGFELLCYTYMGLKMGKGRLTANLLQQEKMFPFFCTAINNVVSSVDIVKAQKASGAVNDSNSEVIGINRMKINEFLKKNCAMIKKLSFVRKYLKVRNDKSLDRVQDCYFEAGSKTTRSLSP